jgi:hypothetical protein
LTLLLLANVARALPFEIGPYLQDVRPDGATVVWEGSESAGEVIVQVGTEKRHFPAPSATHHAVRVEGLPTGSWPYRVVTRSQSRTGTLRTGATGEHPFSFIVYGDSRNGHEVHANLVSAMIAEDPDFLLGTGDLVEEGGSDLEWLRLFDIERPLLASRALYPAAGNHEYAGDPLLTRFRRFFLLPRGTGTAVEPAEHPVTAAYYSFRYGNSLFVALDANHPGDRAQNDWLADTMHRAANDPEVRHVFVFDHQPTFAVGDLCGSAFLQGPWVSAFADPKVRAVFSGHVHAYEHLERGRVRYFVTGGAGAKLDERQERCEAYDEQALVVYRATPHFLRVRVTGPTAALDAISVDGKLLDHVRLDQPPDEGAALPVPFADGLPHGRHVAGYVWSSRTTNRMLLVCLALLLGCAAFARWRQKRDR